MVDKFLEAGFTYFDTAWAYGGSSEDAIPAKPLVERYPRKRKYQLAKSAMAARINLQDKKCKSSCTV
ncbi:MAG: hypothetical protein ACLU6Y_08740 [Ruminococcus sp.]